MHELGHNLGMGHDFGKEGPQQKRFTSKGTLCTGVKGYMDYRPGRNQWSPCSAEDFKNYYTRFDEFCLSKNVPESTQEDFFKGKNLANPIVGKLRLKFVSLSLDSGASFRPTMANGVSK